MTQVRLPIRVPQAIQVHRVARHVEAVVAVTEWVKWEGNKKPKPDELAIAILTANLNGFKRIIASGVSIDLPDSSGDYPIHLATIKMLECSPEVHFSEMQEMFSYILLKTPDVNIRDSRGLTPMHILANHINASDLSFQTVWNGLINAGADPFLREPRNERDFFQMASVWGSSMLDPYRDSIESLIINLRLDYERRILSMDSKTEAHKERRRL